MPQYFVTVDRKSSSLEDLVDKIFYGVKQDYETGKTTIEKITGDGPIRLPDPPAQYRDDYVNWMWSYNNFRFYWEDGRLLMEVL